MGKKVITSKMQRNAENACGYRMWQLGFSSMTSIIQPLSLCCGHQTLTCFKLDFCIDKFKVVRQSHPEKDLEKAF